jgi:hypothetical protein
MCSNTPDSKEAPRGKIPTRDAYVVSGMGEDQTMEQVRHPMSYGRRKEKWSLLCGIVCVCWLVCVFACFLDHEVLKLNVIGKGFFFFLITCVFIPLTL